jgi:seryl-tRNA synthetase
LERRTQDRDWSSAQQQIDELWREHRSLREDFYRHEAVVEERWKTIFNELRHFQDDTKSLIKESKIRIDSLYKLVLTVSGSAILFLVGELVRRGI